MAFWTGGRPALYPDLSGNILYSVEATLAPCKYPPGSNRPRRIARNAVSMLGQRRRRWANIGTALGECWVYS